jgi:hypothetical protein
LFFQLFRSREEVFSPAARDGSHEKKRNQQYQWQNKTGLTAKNAEGSKILCFLRSLRLIVFSMVP